MKASSAYIFTLLLLVGVLELVMRFVLTLTVIPALIMGEVGKEGWTMIPWCWSSATKLLP